MAEWMLDGFGALRYTAWALTMGGIRMRRFFLVLSGLALCVAGCSSNPYVTVTGRVTLDGKPLEN